MPPPTRSPNSSADDRTFRQIVVGAILIEATFDRASAATLVEFFAEEVSSRRFLDLGDEHPELNERINRVLERASLGYWTAADGR